MKKIILALVALATAFAISSCCDQSYCPGNLRCPEAYDENQQETPYRFDNQEKVRQGQERIHRRW